MENSNIIKDEMYYKRLRERFINDPIIKHYQNGKLHIMQNSIPSYVINKGTQEMTTIYEPETQKALDKIDAELTEYIKNTYPEANYKND